MMNFEIQWKALQEQKKDDAPEVPKITKALLIIKQTEAFHTRHQQSSKRVIKDHGCTSPSTFERNV